MVSCELNMNLGFLNKMPLTIYNSPFTAFLMDGGSCAAAEIYCEERSDVANSLCFVSGWDCRAPLRSLAM